MLVLILLLMCIYASVMNPLDAPVDIASATLHWRNGTSGSYTWTNDTSLTQVGSTDYWIYNKTGLIDTR